MEGSAERSATGFERQARVIPEGSSPLPSSERGATAKDVEPLVRRLPATRVLDHRYRDLRWAKLPRSVSEVRREALLGFCGG